MTWKAERGLTICIECLHGRHHSDRESKTPSGDVCLCVCQELDFRKYCDEIRTLPEIDLREAPEHRLSA